jgi:bifunctional DNA-binding transcriptional regulator/antitoxin component of YhaV-PrlF toxin-antitoxin module
MRLGVKEFEKRRRWADSLHHFSTMVYVSRMGLDLVHHQQKRSKAGSRFCLFFAVFIAIMDVTGKESLVMGKMAMFKAKYQKDGHLSVPQEVVTALSLRNGEEVDVMIEKEKFDKTGFLAFFGIWKDKTEEEIDIYRQIVKEREVFGRGEIRL